MGRPLSTVSTCQIDSTFLADHEASLAGALVMDITYGIEVLPENDPYINTAEQASASLSAATIHGSFMVDFLPICMSRTMQSLLILTHFYRSEVCPFVAPRCRLPTEGKGVE